jgi:histidinol phosphatase-like PHP family hydrolase
MIDLHTHSIFSDGVLIPAELLRRYEYCGYSTVAITDHVDMSNLDFIVPRIAAAAEEMNNCQSVRLIPGVEITHVPPKLIRSMVERARALGARVVVVHGETIAEPVAKGTNMAGIEAGADIIAHPGLITFEEAALAAEKGVLLEISGRSGHSLTNGHVVRVAESANADMVLNSDSHSPENIMSREFALKVALGAGLTEEGAEALHQNARLLVERNVNTP